MEQNQQNNGRIEINIREMIGLLLSKAGIILITGIIFAMLSVTWTKIFVTPQYQSVTKMYVLQKQSTDTLTSSDMQLSSWLTKDYVELIKSRTVTESVISDMGLYITHEQLLSKLSVTATSDTRIVTIKVVDPDPYMARDLANKIRDTAAQHIKSVMDIDAVNVVDEANIPSGQFSPNVTRSGIMAGLMGCMIAVIIILFTHLTNDSIKTTEDVEKYLGLSILGTIPLTKEESKKKAKKHSRKQK